MIRYHTAICIFALGVCLLAAPSARAATALEPGLWQDTETGLENGVPAKPEVTTDCMTPADAKDPAKSLSSMKGAAAGQCKKLQVQDKGNVISIEMECGVAQQMSMNMTAIYTILNPRHVIGTTKTTVVFAGHKTTTDKKFDSKWIAAACKK